jgi:alkylation response protein AidB-like acyl-CoA dehydrogenase
MSAPSTTDKDTARIDAALDALLAEFDPKKVDNFTFRGARFDRGLAWVHFPTGHGGLDMRPDLNRHVEERLRAAGAAAQDASTFFMALAGPTIATHGSEEVKKRFLRPMFTGEEKWCQLFSEPGAGSDFAGLGTKAIRDGDEWIINGQKVWNTLAHLADWGMLVTRTDPDAPKHKGMTYFALDMHAPGVEVRPLRQITGEAEFNEVYMTDARVPDAHRVGEVGEGWRAALTTLMNERSAIGGGGGGNAKRRGPIDETIKIWKEKPADQRNNADKDKMMHLFCASEALRLTNMRGAQAAKAGNPGPEGSIAKLMSADFNKKVTEFNCTSWVQKQWLITTSRSVAQTLCRSMVHSAAHVIRSCVFVLTPLKAAQAKSCATFLANKFSAFLANHALTKTSLGAKFLVANSANTKGPLPKQ